MAFFSAMESFGLFVLPVLPLSMFLAMNASFQRMVISFNMELS